MTNPEPTVSADITIDADADAVYALITDLDVLAGLAAETTAMRWTKGDAARVGARFKGSNRNGGKTWSTACTVTAAEPDRTFEFTVTSMAIPIARWRYDLEPVDGGCRVTESTWDARPGWFLPVAKLATGVGDRTAANAEHIRETLARLKVRAQG